MSRKLESRLLNYFMLIAFAAMLIGIEFYFELNKSGLQQEICSIESSVTNINPLTSNKNTPLKQKENQATSLSDIRNKIVIMFGILTVVVAIVLMMFIKDITRPLQKMVNVAQSINQGDLTQIVPVETQDEIGLVGSAINELASNLQEVAAFACVTATETVNNINDIFDREKNPSGPSASQIITLKKEMHSLIEFADTFTLLGTDIK